MGQPIGGLKRPGGVKDFMIAVKWRNVVCAIEADRQFFEELAKALEAVAFDEVRTIGLDADKLKSRIYESVKQVQRELAR